MNYKFEKGQRVVLTIEVAGIESYEIRRVSKVEMGLVWLDGGSGPFINCVLDYGELGRQTIVPIRRPK